MKKILTILILSFLLLIVFTAGCLGSDDKVLTVGIVKNNAPWSYVDENGEYTGFDVESVKWIAKQNSMEVEFVPLLWPNIVNNVANGTVDVIYSSLLISSERSQIIDFSTPYFTSNIAIAVRSDSNLTKDDILSGNYVIAVMSAGTADKWVRENIGGEIHNSDINGIFAQLDSGVADAVISEEVGINRFVRSGPYKNIGVIEMSEFQAVAVRKGDEKTLSMMNDGITNPRSSVEWQRLLTKYNIP